MPAGNASVSCTVVAATVPELVYDRVTVMLAALGEGPESTDSALVTVITDDATVVVSVLLAVFEPVSVAPTVMVAVSPLAAPPGTVPATTKRKMPPRAIGPVVVIGVALSGRPSPFASTSYCRPTGHWLPMVFGVKVDDVGAVSVYVSDPLPVFVMVWG